MRDDVAIQRRPPFVGRIHKMIPGEVVLLHWYQGPCVNEATLNAGHMLNTQVPQQKKEN